MIFFCLPETLRAKTINISPNTRQADEKTHEITRISTTQSVQLETKRVAAFLKRCFIDPLAIIAYLRFPAVALVVYWAAITFGAVSLFIPNSFVPSNPNSRRPVIFSPLYI